MPKPDLRKTIGQLGENIANKWLQKKGYLLLRQNYNIFGGQVDLIMQSPQGEIVFVEVKTRNKPKLLEIAPQVSKRQCLTLQRTANYYIAEHKLEHKSWRFDAIWICLYRLVSQKAYATIRHHQNILGI